MGRLRTNLLRLFLHVPAFDAFALYEILRRAIGLLVLIAPGRAALLAAIDHPVARKALLVPSSTVKHVYSPLALLLVHARFRRDVLNFVGEGVGVHRTVVDAHSVLSMTPGELHPVLVVAGGIIFARMSTAAFGAVGGSMHGNNGLAHQVV